MAFEGPLFRWTFQAGTTVTRYRAVVLAADGQVDHSGLDGDVLGVAEDSQEVVGRAVTVMIFGITKVEAGGAITVGGQVCADASGRAIAIAANLQAFGRALETVTTAGQLVSVLLTPAALKQ